nr:SUMO-activating enzyme subunit 2 [Seculamonas ecuadoriensis]
MSRYSPTATCTSPSTASLLRTSHVLVVGAGGIGCELLKDLVLAGFTRIFIIDLDTIDLSNLNRQFLFRQHHIGRAKAEVARESALVFNPDADITARCGNIKDPQYGIEFFSQFSIVMNALDNLDARRHVNRMCLAASVPLVESGTAGFLGQVQPILKGESECYECRPKAAAKTYPACTIRANPSTMVHCVVWAKMLFDRLFGKDPGTGALTEFSHDASHPLAPASSDAPAAVKDMVEMSAGHIFTQVFHDDIQNLVSLKKSWTGRQPPRALNIDELVPSHADGAVTVPHGTDYDIWSMSDSARHFLASLEALRTQKLASEFLVFDKDDENSLDFVTATSNLRAECFGIDRKSRFDIKAIAGNIIPAVATTNAIVAGLVVLEAIKVLSGQKDRCKMVHCVRFPSTFRRKPCLLLPAALEPPSASCYVCSHACMTIVCNTRLMTLGTFVDKVLRGAIGMLEPMVMVQSDILIEYAADMLDDEDYVRQAAKLLANTRLASSPIATAEDMMQRLTVRFIVKHSDDLDADAFETQGLSADALKQRSDDASAAALAPEESSEDAGANTTDFEIVDDEVVFVTAVSAQDGAADRGTKRTRDDTDDSATATTDSDAPATKRSRA